MRTIHRNRLLLIAFVALASAMLGLAVSQRSLAIVYHKWRMNAQYDTMFGNPEPVGGGLAMYDLEGIDVDAVLESYERHRRALVDLGAFFHLSTRFPRLTSDGTEQHSTARRAFIDRMWKRFPRHKHWYLAPDGTFATWGPVDDIERWIDFLDAESDEMQAAQTVPKAP